MISVTIPAAQLLLQALEVIQRFTTVCLLTFENRRLVLQAVDVPGTARMHIFIGANCLRNYTHEGVTLPLRAEIRRNALYRKLKEVCRPGDSLDLKFTVASFELAC